MGFPFEAQIIEIVKPVKDKIEKLYNEDVTGNYASYSSEIEKLGRIKNGIGNIKITKD